MSISIENKILKIKNKISELGYIIPGSISKRLNVCGSPGCKCKDKKKPQKHGPYYYLSYTFKGKSYTKFISKTKINSIRKAIKNYKKFKELSNELIEKNIELLLKKNQIKDN